MNRAPRTDVLRQRLIFGSLLAAVVVVLMLIDGVLSARPGPDWTVAGVNLGRWLCNGALSTALVLAFSLFTAREVIHLVRTAEFYPSRAVVYVFAAGLVVGPYVSFNLRRETGWAGWHDEAWGMMWLSLAVGIAFLMQAVRRGTKNATANVAMMVFVVFYAGGLGGYMTKLRMEVGGLAGLAMLLLAMFLVKITDAGAFFTGRLIGRHKLIPWLSPKKTWEGLLGGVALALAGALGVGAWLRSAEIIPNGSGPLTPPWDMAVLGLLMAVFSIAGDLCGSLLKRDLQAKDSGRLLPGMGGVLDVFDSPLLAAPAAWFFWTRVVSL